MFDNLREQANSMPFYEDEAQFQEAEGVRPAASVTRKPQSDSFLGMTPLQRFIIAFMILLAVCVLGSMCLLITGRIGLF